MAYDEDTANRIRQILSGRFDVVEKKMMGKLAFMVNGSMCCSVGREGLLVRIEAEAREEVLASPHVDPMKIGERTMKGFVRVAADGFRTNAALVKWIDRGIKAGDARKQRGTSRATARGKGNQPKK